MIIVSRTSMFMYYKNKKKAKNNLIIYKTNIPRATYIYTLAIRASRHEQMTQKIFQFKQSIYQKVPNTQTLALLLPRSHTYTTHTHTYTHIQHKFGCLITGGTHIYIETQDGLKDQMSGCSSYTQKQSKARKKQKNKNKVNK